MLSQAASVEFAEIQRRLDISKSALSKHLSQLVAAGYVENTTLVRQGRSRQAISLTQSGQIAYEGHLAALHAIIDSDS